MKQNRNVYYLNQNKTKLNYVIKFSLIECSLFITHFMLVERQQFLEFPVTSNLIVTLCCHAIFWGTEGLGEGGVEIMQIVSGLELMANLFIFIHNGGI